MSPDEDQDLRDLVRRLEAFELGASECFLCATSIVSGNYTLEHVVPAWAQRRYNLWDQRLTLLNGTGIPYRQLTVPCCDDCNRYRLRPLEDSMSQAVETSHHAVKALPPSLVMLWLAKLLFGILYKELFLLLERSSPDGPTIVTPDFLRCYRTQRLFLQQVRERVRLVDFNQGSVFVFPAQQLPRKDLEWDLCDNVETQFIACRVGRVALFAALGDGGAQQYVEGEFDDIKDMPLHPIQILELCAMFSYRSSLATRTPKYITIQGSPHQVHQMPLGGLSLKPLFYEGDAETYAKFLHFYTHVPLEMLYEPPAKVRTWLRKPTREPNFLDVKDYPNW